MFNKLFIDKISSFVKNINTKQNLLANFKNLTISPVINTNNKKFSYSSVNSNLIQFFDEKTNWTEEKVKHGRPWQSDELRIKSNSDLHKLWYVLHKERNMLLTMEEIYIKKGVPMPSHERLAKVDESMENLLNVVEERDIALNLLETGQTKKIITFRRHNSFGYIQYYRPREYLVPWYLNKNWKLKFYYKKIPYWSKFYASLNRIRLRGERNKIIKKVNYFSKKVLQKYPEMRNDKEFVKKYFEIKYGYKKALRYDELIKRPARYELPNNLKEKIKASNQIFNLNEDNF